MSLREERHSPFDKYHEALMTPLVGNFCTKAPKARTLTFAKISFRRSIGFPKGILLSIRCGATNF